MTLSRRQQFNAASVSAPVATKRERALFAITPTNFEAVPASDGKRAMLKGYAIVWNELSDDRGGYKVRLLPGSAKFKNPTRAYYNHQSADFIGTTSNQTLTFKSDDKGVYVEIFLPDTQRGRDTFVLVRDKYVEGMSFAMVEAPWAFNYSTLGTPTIVPVAGAATVTVENGETIVNVSGGYEVDEVTVTPDPSFVTTTIAASNTPPPKSAGYSTRTAQANRLHAFKFQSLRLDADRLAGATRPHARA